MAAQQTGGPNRIQLDGDAHMYISEEAIATAVAIAPGMWLEKTNAGTVQAHSTAGGWSQSMVAVEDALQGKTVTDAYDASARIMYHHEQPNSRFLAILKAGEDVGIGDPLVSDGAGRMVAETGTPEEIACWAEEVLDLSGSGAVDTLISVRCGR